MDTEGLEFVQNFTYRGVDVKIYEDDYGQCYCFSFEYDGKEYEGGCGTYNFFWKDEVKFYIDCLLD